MCAYVQVMCLVVSVCVCMCAGGTCIICGLKIDLLCALLFGRLLLCVLYYLIVDLNTFKVVFYIQ